MEIALIANEGKKELMAQLCIAYYNTFAKNHLYADSVTAAYVGDASGLVIERLLAGGMGGEDQIAARIAYNEIDCLIYFRDTSVDCYDDSHDLLRLCDMRNIPVATNLAAAEILIRAIDQGELDWRYYVNAKTKKNIHW